MKFIKITLTRRSQKGYLLPAAILLGLGISIMSGSFLKYTSLSSETLNNQSYTTIAQEAANAGIMHARSCMGAGTYLTAGPTLRPNTQCSGAADTLANTGNPVSGTVQTSLYSAESPNQWRATYSVSTKDVQDNITSIGTVQAYAGGAWTNIATASSKMHSGSGYTTASPAVGETVTDVMSDGTDCAIANGKLYCWGANLQGTVGNGTTSLFGVGSPQLVQGAIAGKTVTKVSVSNHSVCAIADGAPYCWGNGLYHQLGSGDVSNRTAPTPNVPDLTDTDLEHSPGVPEIVTDIGTSSHNIPYLGWLFSQAFPHSCALTAEGAVACWGDNGYRQLTGGGMMQACVWVIVEICVPTGYYDFPTEERPRYVKGYRDDSGDFAGKKAERVGASSHDSCLLAEGRMYCWGVPAPLPIICYIPYTGQFSNAGIFGIWPFFKGTLYPFNLCIGTFTNSYSVSSLGGYWPFNFTMDDKSIDASSWEVSSNEGCMMANNDFACFGATPAFSLVFIDSWGPPYQIASIPSNADITDHDNGDANAAGGLIGNLCVVDRGRAKCSANIFNNALGAGPSSIGVQKLFFNTLLGDPTNTDDVGDKAATNVAANGSGGIIVANGQMFCFSHTPKLCHSGVSDNYPLGTTSGVTIDTDAIAATGQVSAGDSHTCGIANGKIFCWGSGANGKLGMGDLNDVSQPTAVPSLSTFRSATDVSAGANHTCAIVEGDLWCWGSDSDGQIGNGATTGNVVTPYQVQGVLAGKRVTKISAGGNSTCAVADGNAYCWGDNATSQLGTNGTTDSNVPLEVTTGLSTPNNATTNQLTGKNVSQISVGPTHACAVANADLFCWGSNVNGRTGLGNSYDTGVSARPVKVTSFKDSSNSDVPDGPNGMKPAVAEVSVGTDFSCATVNGKAFCWGNSDNGRTGRNTVAVSTTDQTVPRQVHGPAGTYYAQKITAGASHACAVINGDNSAANGNLWCWGAGASGQLGDGGGVDRGAPVRITGGATIDTDMQTATNAIPGVDKYTHRVRRVAVNVSAGASSTCAVANGNIICWGAGGSARLGNGSTSNQSAPVKTLDYRYIAPVGGGLGIGPIF